MLLATNGDRARVGGSESKAHALGRTRKVQICGTDVAACGIANYESNVSGFAALAARFVKLAN